MAYLIKTTNVYRVSTVQDALNLRKELENKGGELTSFKYVTKYIKVKGQITDEYQLVTATLQFNDEKNCESNIQAFYDMPDGRGES